MEGVRALRLGNALFLGEDKLVLSLLRVVFRERPMNARTVQPRLLVPRSLILSRNRRRTGRTLIYCHVNYTYKVGQATYAVDGLTRDISRTGCGIRGTIIIPPVRSTTRLALCLSHQMSPISLNARVIWVAGEYFGVEFTNMRREDYLRIRTYMLSVLKG